MRDAAAPQDVRERAHRGRLAGAALLREHSDRLSHCRSDTTRTQRSGACCAARGGDRRRERGLLSRCCAARSFRCRCRARARVAGHAQEGQSVAPDDDLVAILQRLAVDARTVDEHAVEAAVVEQPHTVGLAHDQRVATGDGRVVEAHVRREAAPDASPLACQRHEPLLAVLLVADVLARLLDPALARCDARIPIGCRRRTSSPSLLSASIAPTLVVIRSVLNSDARTNSRPPQPGHVRQPFGAVRASACSRSARNGTSRLLRRCPR